jgi:SAM-dependent methyltransferase
MMIPLHHARSARIEALCYDYAAKPKAAVSNCNLCGHDLFVTLVHSDRYGYPARAQACRCCGLTFLNPVMTATSYIGFYQSIYRPLVSAYHGRLIDAASIQEEQRDYAARLAELLAPHLASLTGGNLLDIGGSTGVVAHHLKRAFGLRATVIDPAPLEVEVARRLELETVASLVEDYEPGDSRYQVVLMCQTVDHLLDVMSSLRKVRALLSDDGLFFIDIVDFRAAYRRNGSVEEAVKIDHPYYLTEPVTEAFLRRAGLAIRAIDYAPDHLHVAFICGKSAPEPHALPRDDDARHFFREVRAVHNRVLAP